MKKLILLFMFAIAVPIFTVSAQDEFGIKAGIIFQSNSPSDTHVDINNAGFTGGIYWRSMFLARMVFIQPELMFTDFGYKFRYVSGTESLSFSGNTSSLDLPVLIGLRLFFLRLNVGPEFKLYTFNKDKDNTLVTSKYGLNAGGGLSFGKIDIDVRYRVDVDKSEFKGRYESIHCGTPPFQDVVQKFKRGGYTSVTVGIHF